MLVTKMAKTVTNIFKLSLEHFVSNIDVTVRIALNTACANYTATVVKRGTGYCVGV